MPELPEWFTDYEHTMVDGKWYDDKDIGLDGKLKPGAKPVKWANPPEQPSLWKRFIRLIKGD